MLVSYVGFIISISGSLSFEFNFGDCPVVINEPCSPKNMKFVLSISSNQKTKSYNLNPFTTKFPPNFDSTKPLKIVIHGYGGVSIDIATTNVTKAYQDIGYNVILVDWEPLSLIPCYASAYVNSWHVGQCVAVLAASLMSLGISPSSLHLIGFSLGAHIAGFAGTHIKRATGIPIGRITGLDPALPFFATLKNTWKLDPEDASFVDVVHTSAGFFGKIEPTGHVDFYMNGGSLQPACVDRRYPPLCSHIMAGLYFAESIYNSGHAFTGVECESLNHYITGTCSFLRMATMGEFINKSTHGVFFVETAAKQPFALGLKSIEQLIYNYFYLKRRNL